MNNTKGTDHCGPLAVGRTKFVLLYTIDVYELENSYLQINELIVARTRLKLRLLEYYKLKAWTLSSGLRFH